MKFLKRVIIFLIILIIAYFLYNDSAFENIKNKNTSVISSDNNLNIYFLDVGEADSILIGKNNEYLLIDGGNYLDKDKLCSLFHYMGIDEFSYIIGTHPHEDHIGGIAQVIKEFSVKHVLMPDIEVEYQSYQNIVKELINKDMVIETPSIGDEIHLDDITLKVLSISNDATDINNSSIVLRLVYDEVSILFMADATKDVELKLLDEDIESDVLKVGHHGSQYATSAQFLKKVNPTYAIISVGKDNEYSHPKSIVLDKLNELNVEVYRTDIYGTIYLASDGKGIFIDTLEIDVNGRDPSRK